MKTGILKTLREKLVGMDRWLGKQAGFAPSTPPLRRAVSRSPISLDFVSPSKQYSSLKMRNRQHALHLRNRRNKLSQQAARKKRHTSI